MADLPNLKIPAIKPAVRNENSDFHEIQNAILTWQTLTWMGY